MPRRQRLSPQDKLVQEKVKAERLKRQKIEASMPPPEETEYIRIEDLPPLYPEDEARLKEEFFAMVDWETMDRALKGLPRMTGETETDTYILKRDYPAVYPATDIWGGITHNGDHPWETGPLLDTPYAQKFTDRLKEAEILCRVGKKRPRFHCFSLRNN